MDSEKNNAENAEIQEIADEQLDAVAGGWIGKCPPCPNCGSENTRPYSGYAGLTHACNDCDAAF